MMRAKNLVYVLACSMFAVASTLQAAEKSVSAKSPSPSEAAVRQVVEQHIQGIVDADVKLLEKSWDTESGRISFVTRDKQGVEVAQTGPITESFRLWTAQKIKGTTGQIQSVDIVNDKMALVKAQISWNNEVFDDYLVLLNAEGQWKLVSKTYTSARPSAFRYGVFSSVGK